MNSINLSDKFLKNIRLIATDIDGTLTDQGMFSSRLFSALEILSMTDIKVFLITGRSAGWVQALINYLPVFGAIAENGGVYVLKNNQKVKPLTPIDDLLQYRQSLKDIFQKLQAQFPKLQESSDNGFRVTDWTFDCEDLTLDEFM